MTDETPEIAEFLQLAVRRGMVPREAAVAATQEAISLETDVRDVLLDHELLDAHELDVLQQLQDPRSLVPGYEVIDVLGQGGMGVVYTARQLALDRLVALKTIRLARLDDAGTVRRAKTEARIVAGLVHPNIATAFDHGVHDGRIYLAMELVEGGSWQDLIERIGPGEERRTWAIARQVAAGLAEAAARGVVHRDVKPANVLLARPPAGSDLPPGVPLAKVTDFGLAMATEREETRVTMAGVGIGTPDYVAPEQVLDSEVDLRADVYALGASVAHALRGSRPYESLSAREVIRDKMSGGERWQALLPENVSPATDALLRRMTAFEPDDRPGDYDTLLAAIDAILASDVAAAPAVRTVDSKSPWRPGITRYALVIGLPCIALGAGLWFARPPADPAPVSELEATVPERIPVERVDMAYLFDGESVPLGRQVGGWVRTEDELGGRRLSGSSGWKLLKLRNPGGDSTHEFGEFAAGVDLGTATLVELHIPANGNSPTDGPRLVVRIDDGGAVFGRRESLEGAFEPIDTNVDRQPGDSDAALDYQTIQVAWQPGGVFASVNGTPVGGASWVDRPAYVLIRAVDGTAHFESVSLTTFEPAAPP